MIENRPTISRGHIFPRPLAPFKDVQNPAVKLDLGFNVILQPASEKATKEKSTIILVSMMRPGVWQRAYRTVVDRAGLVASHPSSLTRFWASSMICSALCVVQARNRFAWNVAYLF